MSSPQVYLARVRRSTVPNSDVRMVSLEVFQDSDPVDLEEGDEFVTVQTQIDLFDTPDW